MRRTKFPVKAKGEVRKYTNDEIIEDLTEGEKVNLLKIQSDVQGRIINIKRDIFNIGQLLHKAKSILPHGMFIPWIEKTFDDDLPYSTAYFYMKVFKAFKDNERAVQYIPTKYLLALTNNDFPTEVRQLLTENPEKIEKQKLQQVNELYELFKSGTIGGSQFLKLAEKQVKLGVDIWKGRTKQRLNTNMRQSLYFGAGDILNRLEYLIKTAHKMQGSYPYDPTSKQHQKTIKQIDDTINGLEKLREELEGGGGMFKQISTDEGDKYI